jgi:hypothetical protein
MKEGKKTKRKGGMYEGKRKERKEMRNRGRELMGRHKRTEDRKKE